MTKFLVAAAACAALSVGAADAASLSTGAGSAVMRADAMADFDAPASFELPYAEGGLVFTPFDGPNTPGGGQFSNGGFAAFGDTPDFGLLYHIDYLTQITPAGGAVFEAVEFLLGDGFSGSCRLCVGGTFDTTLVYDARLNGASVGSGVFDTTVGTIIGISLASGFDALWLAAGPGIAMFGDYQAIALDNVSAQFVGSATAPIPLPASAFLLLGAFGGLAALRRRR
jgi:hypothetical protein